MATRKRLVSAESVINKKPCSIRALVMSNVYSSATEPTLLEDSSLVSSYNSRIDYGQDGVQGARDRTISAGSPIDVKGIQGLNACGNAGHREKVDRHHKNPLGSPCYTMVDAALAITQSWHQSVLVYLSATREAEAQPVGRSANLDQTTRINLNVRPTVRIPAGYKFDGFKAAGKEGEGAQHIRIDLALNLCSCLIRKVRSRFCPMAFETACQAFIPIDRTRLATQQIERLAFRPDEMQQVSFQLLDALDRLRSAEHDYQQSWHQSSQLSPARGSAEQLASSNDRVDPTKKSTSRQ